MDPSTVEPGVEHVTHADRARHALADARTHLKRRAVEVAGFLLVVYVVLKLIPALEQALHVLEHAAWTWLLALVGLEVLSEMGFVLSWKAIVDADNVLAGEGRGRRTADDVAWAQLGGGLLLPGGAWGGMGLGALILRRFGMPTQVIAKRQLTLSFLNTAIDALALILFGVGIGAGILTGEGNALLTLLPAAIAGVGIVAALLVARFIGARGKRMNTPTARSRALPWTSQLPSSRQDASWFAAAPGFPSSGRSPTSALTCSSCGLPSSPSTPTRFPASRSWSWPTSSARSGDRFPLPAGAGSIGGMAGMLIVYGVAHNTALAAVLLHQAIALVVPLTGAAIAQASLRHRLGPLHLLGAHGNTVGTI